MKGRYFVALLLSLLTTALMLGCGTKVQIRQRTISNVVRVFWHEAERYSIMVVEPDNQLKIISLNTTMCSNSDGMHIYQDVKMGDKMWVYEKLKSDFLNGECIIELHLHISSEKDIEGGGWNHGKASRTRPTQIFMWKI